MSLSPYVFGFLAFFANEYILSAISCLHPHYLHTKPLFPHWRREMLLLLKTNDCLRSVDCALGTPVSTHLIMARACLDSIEREAIQQLDSDTGSAGDNHAHGSGRAWSGWRWAARWQIAFASWPLRLRLLVFEWVSWWRSVTAAPSKRTAPLRPAEL